MRAFIASIGLPELIAGLIVLALNAYVLTGGADYGGGLWDLLATGPRRSAQRELIAKSIAPIWEANHVWLIVVVVMLFTAFPLAFSMLAIVLHIPLTLLLVGIVLRGSAFMFRSYGSRAASAERTWGRTFSIASIVVPLLLGVVLGAVSSGQVMNANARIGTTTFADVFIAPWAAAFPLAVGAFALALFSFLAAVYLAVEATTRELQEDFRYRGLLMASGVMLTAAVALVLSASRAPRLAEGIIRAPWSIELHVVTGISAVSAIYGLWRRRYRLARVAAAVQVSCILWGWALGEYPYVIEGGLSIRAAAAPRITLQLLLIGVAGGAAVLIPSLRYLFSTFGEAAQ